MTSANQPEPSKAKCRSATAALFKAIRSNDAQGVTDALKNGANLSAVSRGRTPLERALMYFPGRWSPHVVGSLFEGGYMTPELHPNVLRQVVEGLANQGQAAALAALVANADVETRALILQTARELLCDLLLDEIEAKEERLDERSAASGGERTSDESELVDSVLDGTSEVVDDGDEAFVREVVKHRQELQDESLREAVKDFIRVELNRPDFHRHLRAA